MGHGEDELPDARARHRAPLARRRELPLARSTSSSPRDASAGPNCGYGTIVGQGNGQGGREHGQKCDQLPGLARHREPGASRYIAGVWGVDGRGDPAGGRRLLRDDAQDRRRRDQGPALDLLQSEGLAARQQLRHARAREARVLRGHRLLPERDRAARRHRPSRFAARGGRRESSRRSRDASSRSTRRSTRPARRARTGASSRTSRARSAGRTASPSPSPREIFDELRVASKGGVADYFGITYEKIEAQNGVFWPCPSRGPSRDAAPLRAGLLEPDRARSAGRSTSPTARRVSTSRRTGRRPKTWTRTIPIILTTGRVVSQFLSGTQTRRIGPLVDQYPEPLHRDAPAARGEARHRGRRLGDGRVAARHADPPAPGRDDDPAGHDLHPLPLAGAKSPPTS